MDQQRKNSTPNRDRDLSANTGGTITPIDVGAGDDWPVVIPFESTPSAPSLPIDVFPPALREWIDKTAHNLQVHPDMLVGNVFGALATMVQGGVKVGVKPGWKEGVNMFFGTVAPSGRLKSPAFAKAFAPVRTLEDELRQQAARAVRDAEIERDALARGIERKKHLVKTSKPMDAAKRSEIEAEIAAEKKALDEMPVPTLPRLWSSDATPEALAQILAGQDGVLTIASGEDALFAQLAGRYNDNPAIEPILMGYSNEAIVIDRVREGGSVRIPHPRVSIVTSLQPVVLAQVLSNESNEERGLGARFAFILPGRYTGGAFTVRTPAVPEDVDAAYADVLLRLGRAARGADVFLTFDAGAREAFDAWYGRIREYAEAETTDSARARWLAKHPGRCARIAALLHVATNGLGNATITGSTVRGAIRFADALAEHFEAAIRIGADGQGSKIDVLARAILAWAVGLGRPFSQTEVTRKFKHRGAKDIHDALGALQERCFVRKRPGHGSRSTTTWEPHPEAGLHVPSSEARPWRLTHQHAPEAGIWEFDKNTHEDRAPESFGPEFPPLEIGNSAATAGAIAGSRFPQFPSSEMGTGTPNSLENEGRGLEFPNSRVRRVVEAGAQPRPLRLAVTDFEDL